MKNELSDVEVEQEISVLKDSPHVALARKEQRNKYLRRQRLYTLRWLEKRGRELSEAGITMEDLAAQAAEQRAADGFDELDDDAVW